MKPYRGSLLAAAVLLAALPFSGCGDADNFEQTGEIVLSTSTGSVITKGDVIMTVRALFADASATTTTTTASINTSTGAIINNCTPILEYRAEGAHISRVWVPIAGSEATRVFTLKPITAGILSVIARGKCEGSDEDWKYSNQVDVTVSAPPVTAPVAPPTVSTLTLTASPATVSLAVVPHDVTFNLAGTGPTGCTLTFKFEYSGAGFPLTVINPASQGLILLTPPGPGAGTLTGLATAWCSENPTATKTATASVTVTL